MKMFMCDKCGMRHYSSAYENAGAPCMSPRCGGRVATLTDEAPRGPQAADKPAEAERLELRAFDRALYVTAIRKIGCRPAPWANTAQGAVAVFRGDERLAGCGVGDLVVHRLWTRPLNYTETEVALLAVRKYRDGLRK